LRIVSAKREGGREGGKRGGQERDCCIRNTIHTSGGMERKRGGSDRGKKGVIEGRREW